MKKILVATDFSRSAGNAVEYAAEMARTLKARLILFHACHIPLVGTEIPVEIETMEQLQKRGLEDLEELAGHLRHSYGNATDIECFCKCGFAADEINRYAKANKISMIVMGMRGANDLAAKLFGSVTTAVMEKADCPVLVINQKVGFKKIKKIVLATDMDYNRINLPEPLVKLSAAFRAHVYVLNVVPDTLTVPSQPGEIADVSSFVKHSADMDYTFHFWKGENPVDGINSFVGEKNIDMVVMMPHHRSFIGRIFHPSNTKRMTFHSTLPLLVLNEPQSTSINQL